MARRPETPAQLETLRGLLEQSRHDLGRAATATRRRLDVPARIHAAVRRHPAGWFTASLATGLLAALTLRRRKPAAVPARRMAALARTLGFLVSALRPIAIGWLARQLRSRY